MRMTALISDGLAEAQATGKKLLVFLGENHNNNDTVLLELMAIDIAHELGIKNLGMEQDAVGVKDAREIPLEAPVLRIPATIVPLAEQTLGMKITPYDDRGTHAIMRLFGPNVFIMTDTSLKQREPVMVRNLAQIKDHAIISTGIAHMPKFLESGRLQKDHVLVGLDLTDGSRVTTGEFVQNVRAQYKKEFSILLSRDAWLAGPKNTNRITLDGDSREIGFRDTIRAALGPEKGPQFLEALEKQGKIRTQSQLDAELKNLNDRIFLDPTSAAALFKRAKNYMAQDLHDLAHRDFRIALRHSPGESSLHGEIQRTHAMFLLYVPEHTRQRYQRENVSIPFSQSNVGIKDSARAYHLLEQDRIIPRNLERQNPALYEHLWAGGVSTYIASGKATFQQLADMQKSYPEALYALRHENFRSAIIDGYISAEQVGKLSEIHLAKLKSGPSGLKLREEVEQFIGKELSPPLPEKPQENQQIQAVSYLPHPAA